MGAWTALLVALLLPAAFGTVLIILWIYEGRWSAPGSLAAGPTEIITHLVASVPLSILTLAGRRRFMRWSRGTQVACAAAGWLAMGVTVATVLVLIQQL